MGSRLYLRHSLGPGLLEELGRALGREVVLEGALPGPARVEGGGRWQIEPAEDWPSALMGPRRPRYDARLSALDEEGEAALARLAEVYRGWRSMHAWLDAQGQVRSARPAAPCPICGHRTLSSPGSYGICTLCGWENDGFERDHPHDGSGPNHESPSKARARWWSRIGTRDEPRDEQAPRFSKLQRAQAALRVLQGWTLGDKDQRALLPALRRLNPPPELRARLLAGTLSPQTRPGELALILEHLPACEAELLVAPERGGWVGLRARADQTGVDLAPLERQRALLLRVAGELGWTQPRPPGPVLVEALLDAARLDLLEALGEAGLLRPEHCALLRDALDPLLELPWQAWGPPYDEDRVRLAWRYGLPEDARQRLRVRLAQALAEDPHEDWDWLLEPWAALLR